MAVASSSSERLPESWQVFINFRGEELRKNFISHVEGALDTAKIKYYIDWKETPGQNFSILYERPETPCGSDYSGEEAVRDLVEKFFICISADRIEMHNLLRTFGRELGASNENNSEKRLWNQDTITNILLSEPEKRQIEKGLAFETLVVTCFPGSEVPAWFNHKASGAMLELELSRYWRDNGFVGIALCAIVSFQKYNIQNNNFMVKCISKFNNVETSSSLFNFHIGDLSETKEDLRLIKSTHVFIGFTSWWNMKQCQEAGSKKGCGPPPGLKKECGGPIYASINFEVTDGTCEAANCEVLKCGFSFVCESDNGSWDASADASSVDSESDNDSLDANFDASPMVESNGVSKYLGLLRRRGWFFTLG